jgi:hypothetical protein
MAQSANNIRKYQNERQRGSPHIATTITGLEGECKPSKSEPAAARFQANKNLEQCDGEVCIRRLFLLVMSIFVHPQVGRGHCRIALQADLYRSDQNQETNDMNGACS